MPKERPKISLKMPPISFAEASPSIAASEKPSAPSYMQLLCLDFDQTLVKGHWDNLLRGDMKKIQGEFYAIKEESISSDRLQELCDSPEHGIVDKENLKTMFEEADSNNIRIAITSHNGFPLAIRAALKEIGLSQKIMDNIFIAASDDQTNKNSHIKAAMKHFKISNPQAVCLVDDGQNNILGAQKSGYATIHVDTKNPTAFIDDVKKKTREAANVVKSLSATPALQPSPSR